jgi:hypothetical protein
MTWTVHLAIKTAEAIQYTPSVQLGRETWAHVRGTPPTQWHEWMPICRIPRQYGMGDIDALMTNDPAAFAKGT